MSWADLRYELRVVARGHLPRAWRASEVVFVRRKHFTLRSTRARLSNGGRRYRRFWIERSELRLSGCKPRKKCGRIMAHHSGAFCIGDCASLLKPSDAVHRDVVAHVRVVGAENRLLEADDVAQHS